MERDTVVPRPGVEANIIVRMEVSPAVELGQQEIGQLEQAINDRFVEPRGMGSVDFVFRSRVAQNAMMDETIRVVTSSSVITEDVFNEMVEIVEDQTEFTVDSWEMETTIQRKSLGVDEV